MFHNIKLTVKLEKYNQGKHKILFIEGKKNCLTLPGPVWKNNCLLNLQSHTLEWLLSDFFNLST